MWTRRSVLAAFALTLGAIGNTTAGESEFSGFVAAEVRGFEGAPAFAGQDGSRAAPSLLAQPEFRYEWNEGADRLTWVAFLRVDETDRERSHADVRELNWLHVGEDWDLRIGLGKVFWGVTESRHLVDIVNQTDLVESLDEEDKLGQPMINLNLERDWGAFGLFVLPYFRERTFPGRRGRLRNAVPVSLDDPLYESGAGRHHLDVAARWSRTFGDWDVGVAHFHGTGRQPRFLLGFDSGGRAVLVPFYEVIDQTGLDVQLTRESWLWKLETITRGGQGERFAALNAGFEYTFYGVFESAADIGFIAEYLYDGRGDRVPATTLDDDLFAGLRLVLNDAQSTQFLASAIVDRDTGAKGFSLEAERRIGEDWKVEVEVRIFSGVPSADVLAGVRKDDFLQIRVSRFF